MIEKLKANNILEFRDSIYSLQYEIHANELNIQDVPFQLLLRPFKFYENDFKDLEYASTACMSIFAAFVIASGDNKKNKFTVNCVKRTLEILSGYLDGTSFSIQDHENPSDLLFLNYDFMEKLGEFENILEISPIIIENEKALQRIDDAKLSVLLNSTVEERVAAFVEVVSALSSCKNCLYNIIRSHGLLLIEDIKKNIDTLLPADQNFLLHGLDAYPKNEEVIAFYKAFIIKNENTWIGSEAGKYLERVEAGQVTTGWED